MNTLKKSLVWSIGLVALLILAWAAQREPVQWVSTAQVSRGPLEQRFLEEGRTRLKQRYVVTAPVAGHLQRMVVQAGDPVRQGQVLALIEPATAGLLDARSRTQALAEVAASRSVLQAAQQRIGAAEAANALAQRELDRVGRLAAAGMATASQLDGSRTQAASAAAALGTARADLLVAEQRQHAAQAVLGDEGSSRTARTLQVTAPIDGMVMRKVLESATPVAVGQPLVEVGNPRDLDLEVEVLSTDAVRVVPGQLARVLRWGGETALQARVARVEPGGFTKVSALGVEEQRTRVILDITTPRDQWAALGDAYRVEVEFILRQVSDVLLVPTHALFRHGSGWAVYVVEDGKARLTEVTTGLRDALASQVNAGLTERQTVIVQPDDRIRNGSRVRVSQGTKNGT